jgi:hypothetical protein
MKRVKRSQSEDGRWPLEAGEGKGVDSSLPALGKHSPGHTFFSPARFLSDIFRNVNRINL